MISLALYKPDIPQNTASIIRLCACFGVKIHIIEPCGFNLNDYRFKRVVMDYIGLSSIIRYETFEQFAKKNKKSTIVLMTTRGKISLYKYGYKIDFTSIFKIKKYYHSNLYKFPCDCLDEFKEVDFKNVQVKIPIKYEKYLTFLYGNWKSPKKDNYATIKSTRIIHYKYIISQLLHYLKLK